MARFLPLCVLLFALPAAADPSILSIEPRIARGLAMGGGAGEGHARLSPFTVGILVDYLLQTDPFLSFYGGPFVEIMDRGSLGAMAGIRLRPNGGPIRLALGGAGSFVPYTIGGVTASVGTQLSLFSVPISLDLEGVAYFFGNDLPEGTVAGQIRLVVGIPIEVF